MNREHLLNTLHSVSFTLIDPPSEWEDIGFTERPIWVNAKGYGYIMCDEPCSTCEAEGVPLEKWKIIRQKLSDGSLQLDDIQGTSVTELLDEITHGYFDEEEDDLCELLEGLCLLPTEQIDHIWGVESFDGWLFFATEEAFNNAYERDWYDVAWDDLSDEALTEWIDRLTDEGLLCGKYIASFPADDAHHRPTA